MYPFSPVDCVEVKARGPFTRMQLASWQELSEHDPITFNTITYPTPHQKPHRMTLLLCVGVGQKGSGEGCGRGEVELPRSENVMKDPQFMSLCMLGVVIFS